jgi:hypothetical protein
VTRGTRPKKPSSSRGFARVARGARGVWGFWGFWGLKTENRKLKIEKEFSLPLSRPATTTKKKLFFIFLFFLFYFFSRPRGFTGVRADSLVSARMHLVLPQVTLKRTLQCV